MKSAALSDNITNSGWTTDRVLGGRLSERARCGWWSCPGLCRSDHKSLPQPEQRVSGRPAIPPVVTCTGVGQPRLCRRRRLVDFSSCLC